MTKGGELGFGGSATPYADQEKVGFFEFFFESGEVVFVVVELDDGDVVVLHELAFKEGRQGGFGLVFPLGDEREDPGLCGISHR